MGEVGYEGRSVIADYFFWKSMMMPDVLQEQPGDSSGVQGGDCGYGMNLLRQAIHHQKDGIVPLGVQEFSDHVYSVDGEMCSAVHYQPKQPKTLPVLNRGGAGETEADLCIELNRQLILFQTHRLVAGTQASEPNMIKPDPDLLEG